MACIICLKGTRKFWKDLIFILFFILLLCVYICQLCSKFWMAFVLQFFLIIFLCILKHLQINEDNSSQKTSTKFKNSFLGVGFQFTKSSMAISEELDIQPHKNSSYNVGIYMMLNCLKLIFYMLLLYCTCVLYNARIWLVVHNYYTCVIA